jgi:hypothetical protein
VNAFLKGVYRVRELMVRQYFILNRTDIYTLLSSRATFWYYVPVHGCRGMAYSHIDIITSKVRISGCTRQLNVLGARGALLLV